MFEFDKMIEVIGIWFVSGREKDGQGVDFMAVVSRKRADGPWEIRQRFRYHHSAEPFDERDEKNWYAFEGPDPDRAKQSTDLVAQLCAARYGGTVDFVDCQRRDGAHAVELMTKRPWCHVRRMEAPQ